MNAQKIPADDVYIDNLLRHGRHVFDTTPLLATLKGHSKKWLGKP